MPICDAFAQIEQQPNIYDVVHVKYHDEDPLKLDIVISFPDHGFHLRFDPWSQVRHDDAVVHTFFFLIKPTRLLYNLFKFGKQFIWLVLCGVFSLLFFCLLKKLSILVIILLPYLICFAEVTPCWDLWCQAASDALRHFYYRVS